MKIALIGVGSIGLRHLNNLSKLGYRDVIIFDTSKGQIFKAKKILPSVVFCNKINSIWQQLPNIVFINTPTYTHISYAIKAAHMGCHIFIEKPLSNNLKSIKRLLTIIDDKNLTTMVGCNMRYYWAIRKIKELISKKIIGKLYAAHIESGSYLPEWRKNNYRKTYSAQKIMGGGIILDGIHELDYAIWFFGKIIKQISMYGKVSKLDIDTEDVADVLLKFESGPIVNIHLDYLQHNYSRNCKIIGEKGTIIWNFSEHLVKIYSHNTKKWQLIEEPRSYNLNQMYIDEIKYFLDCVKQKRNTLNSVISASQTLRIALNIKNTKHYVT
ncbi:MAG: Oxidoreductase, NAD-binding domain protein [Candidatus Gottesmanbacteria bacterium GW2011_GWA1_34_13]|uniref:Oxidoreductase, NAD-binding domain protein n=1 Tax=Candidatus Gottesmanbacteria bacterium GW2011_GWA1_34_13 TaxID=1618434 RepID=A0A0G0D9H5_9BACT|nr:MAG: Oxidoreductase, NAD-binding domain protein [Candidatus Gottesmanbacteria bacterium GW2011_GWA1_34_13]